MRLQHDLTSFGRRSTAQLHSRRVQPRFNSGSWVNLGLAFSSFIKSTPQDETLWPDHVGGYRPHISCLYVDVIFPQVWEDERGFHMLAHGHFDENGALQCVFLPYN